MTTQSSLQIYIASKNIIFSSNADCSIPSNSPHYTKMNCIPNIWTNLSIVRIFRSAADHVKNATLVGTLTLQILFQGKV